ncbi:MAG: hypothetical protein WBF33_13275 [Candidatus Nitrosopolaris sp.]
MLLEKQPIKRITCSQAKTNKQQSEYPFDRFASIRRYSSFDFLKKDPSWIIIIADTNGQFNLCRQRCTLIQEDGGSEPYASYQLTNFIDDAVRNAFTSPVDNSIIFFADHQGTENYQIYAINDSFHSWPRPITQNPTARYEWGGKSYEYACLCKRPG